MARQRVRGYLRKKPAHHRKSRVRRGGAVANRMYGLGKKRRRGGRLSSILASAAPLLSMAHPGLGAVAKGASALGSVLGFGRKRSRSVSRHKRSYRKRT